MAIFDHDTERHRGDRENRGDRGDPEDRGALLRGVMDRHAAALELYARQWCDTPEDVVQESLLKLARQRRTPEHVVGWLYRVVRNGAISAGRSAGRRRRHEAAAGEARAAWFTGGNGDGLDAGAATEAMGALPIEQREVIVAHLWGGLTFEAIGDLAGCSSSTAHRRYLAGLAALRERLGLA